MDGHGLNKFTRNLNEQLSRRRMLRGLLGGGAAALTAAAVAEGAAASGTSCTYYWAYRLRPSYSNRNWTVKRKVLVKKCGKHETIVKEHKPVTCYNPGGREMWNRNQCS
jgi:hypothetical protein